MSENCLLLDKEVKNLGKKIHKTLKKELTSMRGWLKDYYFFTITLGMKQTHCHHESFWNRIFKKINLWEII